MNSARPEPPRFTEALGLKRPCGFQANARTMSTEDRCTSPTEIFPIRCERKRGHHECVLAPRRELSISRPRVDTSICGTTRFVLHPYTFSAFSMSRKITEISDDTQLGVAENTRVGVNLEGRIASIKPKIEADAETSKKEMKVSSALSVSLT
jgi:hypothetical protein